MSDSPFQQEPATIGVMTEILIAARQQKALFDAYVESGFSEDQALELTKALLQGVPR